MTRVALIALLFAACTSSESTTGASCPTADAPTYTTFGTPFFAKYCTDCHSATALSRHGAPADVNFDTMDDIRKHAGEIDGEAAAGPAGMNEDMPIVGAVVRTAPTQVEREQLGQFLACVQEGKN